MSYKEMYGEEMALKAAAVTKLTRNLGLALAIPGLSYMHASSLKATNEKDSNDLKDNAIEETMSGLVSFQKYVPPFLIAFLGMSTIRSLGDYAFANEVVTAATDMSNTTSSSPQQIFQQTMDFLGNDLFGWRPFAVGGSGALVVGGTGFMVSSLIM